MPELSELDRETLEYLYVTCGRTDTEIAKEYGTYQVKISRLRSKWSIGTVLKSDRVDTPSLSEVQAQVLIGSLLGDGHIATVSTSTARYGESHSIKQKEYLEWKASIFGELISKVSPSQKRVGDRVYKSVRYSSRTTREFRTYYDLFYPAGKKVFPADLPDLMTPLVLAVWFMDDGSCSSFHPRIAFGLCDLSLKRAIKALRKLGLKPAVHEDNRDNGCAIRFPDQADLFFEIIGAHIPDCMAYKRQKKSKRREQDKKAKGLTPQKAKELYRGGMSITEIARLFDVGTSTARRRVRHNGPPKKMGRPRKKYTLRTATVALDNFNPTQWPSLTSEQQDQWVNDVYAILRKISFPYPQELDPDQLDQEFGKLQAKVSSVNEDDRFLQPRSIAGLKMCYPYFPNRYEAIVSSVSAYESWHREGDLKRAIKYQLRVGDPVLPHRVLRAITMQVRTPTIFRPAVAKYIYENYSPEGGLVYDPCAGYGGRMLGALAAGRRYIGTDVEPRTIEGNKRLADALGKLDQVELHECPAEVFEAPGGLDLVFTSPPYYTKEWYSLGENQSAVRHGGTLESWVGGFLYPVIQKVYGVLKPGGYLVLNIADVKVKKETQPLVAITMGAGREVGFEFVEYIKMPLASLNRKDAFEPILVFRKC